MEDLIEKTAHFVKDSLAGAEGGHDWHHTDRVRRMAGWIREQEGEGDRLTIELAALLHDISDAKFNQGDHEAGGRLAFEFLTSSGLDEGTALHVRSIIDNLSFKGGTPQDRISTIEFRIVQDADRLDAMGAIGIARAFNYGGYKNRPIHDPSTPVREYGSPEAYYGSNAPTINHFYEKLLKLKDLMNTRTGKKLAQERHEFMRTFLEQFFRECDPEKEWLRKGSPG